LNFAPGASQLLGLSQAGDDPHTQAQLRSTIALSDAVSLDTDFRYVGPLPDPHVPAYVEMNGRLGWKVSPMLELSLSGFNLLHAHHMEHVTGSQDVIGRSFFVETRWRRILAFSRRQPLSPKAVRLGELIAGMGDLLRHSVGEKITIATQLNDHWSAFCDVNQMENVILNLAINARDAMPEGGTLAIETRDATLTVPPPDVSDFTPGDYVLMTLRDNGEGMSEAVRQRALDPFFTTKPLGKGTGLGLSMTFGFVRQSNGYLAIVSTPGRGAAITIYMPRHVESAP